MRDGLKIISYNILNGGLGRLDPIYETLLYLDGDVVGLCEADDLQGTAYLADKLGMEHVTAQGDAGAVALLSRLPIQRMVNLSVKMPELDRGAMEAVVETQSGPLRVVVTHLAAGQYRENEEKRLQQVEPVIQRLRGEPMATAWMGDFNSGASYHPFEYESASPKVKARLAERGVKELDRDVVDLIAREGWVDGYHRIHSKNPKHTFTTGFPATRFDYIWLGGGLERRLADADVEQGGFAPATLDAFSGLK